jgi:hypothetical protein
MVSAFATDSKLAEEARAVHNEGVEWLRFCLQAHMPQLMRLMTLPTPKLHEWMRLARSKKEAFEARVGRMSDEITRVHMELGFPAV